MKNKQKELKIKKKKQVNALKSLESFKPKELKPKETKQVEYNDYFIKGLVEIRTNNKPTDFNDLRYDFKGPEHALINFIKFKHRNHSFKSIHDGDIA